MARRIRAPVADLSEYGKRYKGKNVTRKEILDSEDEDLDEEDEEESDASNIEDDEDEEEDDDDDDEEEEMEEEEENIPSKSKPKNGQVKEANKNGISLINLNHSEEKAKGKAVKNQLSNYF